MNRRLLRTLLGWTLIATLAPVAHGQTVIVDPVPMPPNPPMPPGPPIPEPHPRPRPVWPRPVRATPLIVSNYAIDVSIVDGVATTNIDQVFHNPLPYVIEGTYIFPLDDDVAIGKFSMFINGQEVEGKVLSTEEARRVYESIVAKMRDPALLEYVGRRMFQARIAPINPNSDTRVRLSYTQMLTGAEGIFRYRYPLDTERHLSSPVGNLSLLVKIESRTAIKSVFSPSHKVAVNRPNDYRATASYEGKNVFPDHDFDLYYGLSDREFGLTMLTYRAAGEEGYFLARIAPPAAKSAGDVLPKDICFVFDTSGSMSGEKIEQARRALKFCLSNLNRQDRYNIVTFAHEPTRFRDTLVEATPEEVAKGQAFADELKAIGGTNIHDALLAALQSAPPADESRPYLIVFMTDGQPTVGVTDPDEILKDIRGGNTSRTRLFVFGVGEDVNTVLLDTLAEQSRGTRDYVELGEDLELKLSAFYRKVADPVLADIKLSFGDVKVHDVYPQQLGDLFSGSELVVMGRYGGEGAKAIEITGRRRGKEERFVYEYTFPTESRGEDFLPRLWAIRKVGYLIDQIRLHGDNKELKDTIVALATQYGIVTPYTAYLITESPELAGGPVGNMQEFLRSNLSGARFYGFADSAPARGASHVAWSTTLETNGINGRALSPPSLARARFNSRLGAAKSVTSSNAALELQRNSDANFGTGVEAAGYATEDALTLDADDIGESRKEQQQERRRLVVVGNRTFYFDGAKWVDSAYDGKTETRKVETFSEEYFKLMRDHAELRACFANGPHVIVVHKGNVYETVPPPEPEAAEPEKSEPEKKD
jgi:Ca-activated chloride channel family protein